MKTTPDGFVHQSRQDDLFEETETFVQCVYLCLTLTALKRILTPEETHLLERATTLGIKFLDMDMGRWRPTAEIMQALQ